MSLYDPSAPNRDPFGAIEDFPEPESIFTCSKVTKRFYVFEWRGERVINEPLFVPVVPKRDRQAVQSHEMAPRTPYGLSASRILSRRLVQTTAVTLLVAVATLLQIFQLTPWRLLTLGGTI